MTEKSTARRQRKPKIPKKITPDYLYNSGLYYLQRYAASSAYFQRVMTQKIKRSCAYHTDQDLESCLALLPDLVEKLTLDGFLDDEGYTKAMVYSLRRKGYASSYIVNKLKTKGIERSMAQKHLSSLDRDDNDNNVNGDLSAALRFMQRKRIESFQHPISGEDTQKAYTKALGKLARAGFSYDIAKKALESQE